VVQLEDQVLLPEGMRVSVIPVVQSTPEVLERLMTLQEWLREARQVRAQLPKSGDSVDILRRLREERASR
jgi:hypothetical protein